MKGARYHVPDRGAIEGVPDARVRADEAAAAFPDAAHEDSGEVDLPLYLDIRRDMHMRLATGEYTTGAAIPSEAKLAEQYGTTKVTIRNAPRRTGGGGAHRPRPGEGHVRHAWARGLRHA